MKVAGLFSGIGGLELPFGNIGASTSLLCDVWDASQKVLAKRFPGVPVHDDISTLERLPAGISAVTAGFPCTDLSQAGRTSGIKGKESGLVAHVFRLLRNQDVEWLILENVRNMLVLDKGKAMAFLTSELESLGFRWAYRLVDSRFSGVPQRRHRVLFVASRHHDPRRVLFADNEEAPDENELRDDAFGFYWTEGLRGLGWARDAIPPLKGGSGLGIPSPPAIWVPAAPEGMRIVTPSIEDAEELQGFQRGWTEPAADNRRNGPRWKLVGNAVTVGVAKWLVQRMQNPADPVISSADLPSVKRWPASAFGENGRVWQFNASMWPVRHQYNHLTDVVDVSRLPPLSLRATAGFLSRAARAQLNFDDRFIRDLRNHETLMGQVQPHTSPEAGSVASGF